MKQSNTEQPAKRRARRRGSAGNASNGTLRSIRLVPGVEPGSMGAVWLTRSHNVVVNAAAGRRAQCPFWSAPPPLRWRCCPNHALRPQLCGDAGRRAGGLWWPIEGMVQKAIKAWGDRQPAAGL